MSKSIEASAHFIVALPPSGVPAQVLRAVQSIREQFGKAYTTVYCTTNPFTMKPKERSRVRTSYWMEASSKPIKKRASPEWPLKN